MRRFAPSEIDLAIAAGRSDGSLDTVWSIIAFPVSPISSKMDFIVLDGSPHASAVCLK